MAGVPSGGKVERISGITDEVLVLADAAEHEGHRNIRTLVAEYISGKNRFSRPGEALFGAYEDDGLIGIGGLNIDPYEDSETIGRVRRLYVLPAFRRGGIASLLMGAVEKHAARHFQRIQLYTASEAASRFYLQLGYSAVEGRAKVSHEKRSW